MKQKEMPSRENSRPDKGEGSSLLKQKLPCVGRKRREGHVDGVNHIQYDSSKYNSKGRDGNDEKGLNRAKGRLSRWRWSAYT